MSARRLLSMGYALLVAGAVCVAGCERQDAPQPKPSPSAQVPAPAAPSSSAPVLGGMETNPAPLSDLKVRTYVAIPDGDLVHVGTEGGLMTVLLGNDQKPAEKAMLMLQDSITNMSMLDEQKKILAVATGPAGLALVDVSEAGSGKLRLLNEHPWVPSQRAGCHAAWQARAMKDSKAVVACGGGGVGIADVSQPGSLQIVSTTDVGGYVRDVALVEPGGNKVVAAAGKAGVVVLELGAKPKVLASVPTTDARAVAVAKGLAYVADGAGGLRIIDVQKQPTELAQLAPPASDAARGIAVEGDTVYLCMGEAGLVAIDARDPKAPKELTRIDPRRAVNRVTAAGGKLLAANDADGLLVIDASKPGTLTQLFPKPGS